VITWTSGFAVSKRKKNTRTQRTVGIGTNSLVISDDSHSWFGHAERKNGNESTKSCTTMENQQPFYNGHYTGQPALAGTSS